MAARSKTGAAKLAKAEAKAKQHKNLSHHATKAKVSEAHMAVIDAYFANGCLSQRRALLACGYSPAAASRPQIIFQRDDVADEIERRRKRREKRTDVTEEKIIAELAKLAFANVGDLLEVNEDGSAFMDFNKLTPDLKAALAEYQVETYDERAPVVDGEADVAGVAVTVKKARVKFASKQAALDSLARIKGMFKDKVEVSGSVGLVERIQEARKRLQPTGGTE